jgi:hypothetical protein
MKLRDRMLLTVVAAVASFAGCAVCDTCDDFPAPCVGPNCGQKWVPGSMNGPGAEAMPVMGASTRQRDERYRRSRPDGTHLAVDAQPGHPADSDGAGQVS